MGLAGGLASNGGSGSGGSGASEIVNVSQSSGDVAAILAAITADTSGGLVSGRLRTTSGGYAAITTPTVISLGYPNANAANLQTSTPQKVKLSLDILPSAGLGAALTIKSGFGVELDINVLGGGQVATAADCAMTGRTTSADGTIAAGGSTLTSASAAFTAADANCWVTIPGAGTAGATIYAQIGTVVNSTTVTIIGSAITSVTTAAVYIGTITVSSPNAIAGGLAVGSVVNITGAGPSPEGVTQPLMATVRSVNSGAGTFTVSESCWANVSTAAIRFFDVAVTVQDTLGLKLNLYGKGYSGCLLAADAFDNSTLMVGNVGAGLVSGLGCGKTVFWKGMGNVGNLGLVSSMSAYGDYFGSCADLTFNVFGGVYTGPSGAVATANNYLWLDRCTNLIDCVINVGNRAIESDVKITGDSAGNVSDVGQIVSARVTGYVATGSGTTTSSSNQITAVANASLTFKVGESLVMPGVPAGTTITAVSANGPGTIGNGWTAGSPGTITMSNTATSSATSSLWGYATVGMKLIGVSSIEVGMIQGDHLLNDILVIGGGGHGLKFLLHESPGSTCTPLAVNAGTVGTTPRVDVHADWRFMTGPAFSLGSGLTAGSGSTPGAEVKLSGYMDSMQVAFGSAGNYAGVSASSACLLDVFGLHQQNLVGLSGFISPGTVTLKNQPGSRLDNDKPAAGIGYLADGSGGWTATALSAGGVTPPGYIAPASHGYQAWTMDPGGCASANVAATTGKPYYSLIAVPQSLTVNNLSFVIVTAGSATTWTSGQCFIALTDASGTLLGQSADLSTALASQAVNSELKASIGTNIAVPAGYCYAYLLLNWSAGTVPAFLAFKSVSAAMQIVGIASGAARVRSAMDNFAVRAAPVSKAITSLTQIQGLAWAALT